MNNNYTWKELEIKFSELSEKMKGCRIDFQWGLNPLTWNLVGCNDSSIRDLFYTLCAVAGKKFIDLFPTEEYEKIEDLKDENSFVTIWIKVLKLYSGNFEHDIIGETKDVNGNTVFLQLGRIYKIAQVSANMCINLSMKLGEENSNPHKESLPEKQKVVFIGHGRSKLWARVKIYLEDELNIKTISYESESRVGDSIIPILEGLLRDASFAILILTAEDETKEGKIRARQNVIHEVGLFQGKLGFKKAIILRQEGLEDLTNLAGVQYIGFTNENVEQTFYELRRVLKREEIIS